VAFERITVRADQMDGVPCIRGLRIPVATVVGMVADGMTVEEILAAYPDLGGPRMSKRRSVTRPRRCGASASPRRRVRF
jgi:hypothetical protein